MSMKAQSQTFTHSNNYNNYHEIEVWNRKYRVMCFLNMHYKNMKIKIDPKNKFSVVDNP